MWSRTAIQKYVGFLAVGAGVSCDCPARHGSVRLILNFFGTRVEPILLKQRRNHARCYACHKGANNGLSLASLPPGSATYTEGQSRQNFQTVSQLVVPGRPTASRFLTHALAPEAGGDPGPIGMHHGGRQFESQDDPDWKTLAEWVNGATASSDSGR